MSGARIERIDVDGVRAWRKRYGYEPRRLRLGLLRRLVDALGIEPLRPPPVLPAAQARETEIRMLRQLSAIGCRVPALLAEEAEAIVIADLGRTLASACKAEKNPDERQRLIRAGFDALGDLHSRGGWLNQAFARNLTLSDGRIGFIDLDQDPSTVMSTAAAQARDLLLYVYSTARFLAGDSARYAHLLDTHLRRESPAVRDCVERAIVALAWLAPLARVSGRELGAMARVIAHIVPRQARGWRRRFLLGAGMLFGGGTVALFFTEAGEAALALFGWLGALF
jgi:tRNA A-37 threonylcarbamoyl transferase component Bud32